MTPERFQEGIALLSEAFPNREINAKLFYAALKDLNDHQFTVAVLSIVQTTSKLYPDDNLIAIIREKVFGPAVEQAILAWTKARRAIFSVGAYRSVSFADSRINGVIESMGGWEKFCGMKTEEEPFRKNDFLALYQAISNRGTPCPERLIGISERLNGTQGNTVLIGHDETNQLAKIGHGAK